MNSAQSVGLPVKRYLSICIAATLSTTPLFTSFSISAAEKQSLDTITVTGEKSDKSLKDTASAVTVITADEYENGELKNVNDVATSAPNVITEGFGAISIRGINGTGASTGGYAYITGGRARISTIVDGVSQVWSGYGFTPSKLWDSNQVEVLRGPQSTVQGTNSIGGALVVTTNDPTFKWEAAARAGLDNYENGNIKNNLAVMINAPIIDDELAFRIAIDGSKGDGWMNYAQADDELDTSPDVEESKNANIRAKLLWEPASNPNLSAKLTLNHNTYDGEYLNWANDVDDNYASETLTLDSVNRSNTRLQDSTIDSIATDISYEIDSGLTNHFNLSYLSTDVAFEQYPLAFPVSSKKENWALEDRLLFNDTNSVWSGIAGIYFAHNKSSIDVDNKSTMDGNDTIITSALFGEANYKVTDRLTLTAGGRVENEDADRYLLAYGSTTLDQDTSHTNFLPKVGISYALSPKTTVSGTIQKGYNGGGGALNWTTYEYYYYEKETVIAYETGIKSQVTENADVSANLFYNDYSGYQAFVNSEYIENIDSAHTYGLELEGNLWATSDLKLNASIGLLNSKVDSDDTSDKGNELPSAPNTNLSAGFTQYIGNDLSFGADITYVGEYYSDLSNTSEYKAGDYTTANARIQYVIGDFTIDGYVTNLTDEDIILYNNSNSRSSRAAVGQTRTFGISATYRM
ncbi:TonB-dependent receptor [Vibrio sp.]|nr:TonB-dependent receptor [Vibrio viridaestus]MDC0610472.1 TonB-dependent receptor [Vibrio sp.]